MTQAIVAVERFEVTAMPRVRTAVVAQSSVAIQAAPRRTAQIGVVAGPRGKQGESVNGAPEIIISNTEPAAPTAAYLRFETDGSGNVQRVLLGRP